MSLLGIISDIWKWIRVDIIGGDIASYTIVFLYMAIALSSMGLPSPIIGAILVPTTVALIILSVLGWFGWLIIIMFAILFGVLLYRLIG